MFQPVHVGNGLPVGFYNVDFSCEFQAGMMGGLTVVAGEVVMSVANGTTIPPYGILDDYKDSSFQRTIRNDLQVVNVPSVALAVDDDGDLTTSIELMATLDHSNLIASTFAGNVDNVVLNATNGVVTFPAGSKLNFDMDGDGTLDSIKIVSSYVYRVSNVPGDDSCAASGKVTVWHSRGEYITDQYEPSQPYPINAILFCSCNGKFTTQPEDDASPGIGSVTATPTALDSTMQLVWF